MNSVYGILSTDIVGKDLKLIGSAYLPFHPGYVYAAVPSTHDELVNEIRVIYVIA